jgi:hypothetical protein
MTLSIAIAIATLVAIILLIPFFAGPGGRLVASSASQSISELERQKQGILARYVHEEREFNAGEMSSLSWNQRRSYLVNRYVDASRRLDFLHAAQTGEAKI